MEAQHDQQYRRTAATIHTGRTKFRQLELLIPHGEFAAARRELLRSFAPMALQTGTLWEMLDPSASCNHGFTSYVAVLIDRLAAAGPRHPVRPVSRRA